MRHRTDLDPSHRSLAHVAGTQEPIYGPSAIRSVAQEAEKTPYTETTRKDLAWQAKESTCVETLTFYFMSESRHLGLAQVIYSNVAYGKPFPFPSDPPTGRILRGRGGIEGGDVFSGGGFLA